MKIPRTIPALLFFLFLRSSAYTQDSSLTTSSVILDFSAGLGAVEAFAYTVTTEIQLRKQHQLMALQILYSKEFDNFLPIIDQKGYPTPRQEILNVALLYGTTYSFRFLRIFF